jgi:hypothetical protein
MGTMTTKARNPGHDAERDSRQLKVPVKVFAG